MNLELLLSNHNQDCLSCVRSTNCELQTLCREYGVDSSRFTGTVNTYAIDDKTPIIRDNNKCILCRRCVATCAKVQEIGVIGANNRGFDTYIGNGVIIDAKIFKDEIDKLAESGIDIRDRLLISNKSHLIIPTHRALDAANEKALQKNKIGSTLKGIGPTYTDKTARRGIRIGDIASDDFKARYERLKNIHLDHIRNLDFDMSTLTLDNMPFEQYEEEWFKAVEFLKQFKFIESEYFINKSLDEGKRVLAEGEKMSQKDLASFACLNTTSFIFSSN